MRARCALARCYQPGARPQARSLVTVRACGFRLEHSSTHRASREANEDILQGDWAMRHFEDARIRLVLLNQATWCVDGNDPALIHDGHAVTHRLSLFHGMGREQN